MEDNTSAVDFDLLHQHPLYQQQVMENMFAKAHRHWEEHLKQYLKDNLQRLGYLFDTDYEFISFCKERVTRVNSQPNEWDLYIDWNEKQRTGTLIGSYSAKTGFEEKKGTITIKIG